MTRIKIFTKKNFEILILLIFITFFLSIILFKYYGEPRKTINQHITTKLVKPYKIEEVYSIKELKQEADFIKKNTQSNNTSKTYTNTVPVIVYHGISSEENGKDISVKNFKEHMFELKKNGYETINLDDLYLFLRGEKKIKENSFIITFDDGRKDSYYYSDPIFEILNYSAVMFIIGNYSIDKHHPYYLNNYEINKMIKSQRWELQSHSFAGHGEITTGKYDETGSFFGNKHWHDNTHNFENDSEYYDRIYEDLKKSKNTLENKFNLTITSFAIPFGDFGQYDSNFKKADMINSKIYPNLFKMVFFQYKPIKDKDFRANYNDRINQDFYFVMRINIPHNMDATELINTIEATKEINLPYYENFDNSYKWLDDWGIHKIKDSKMRLKTEDIKDSSQIYLDGSYLWNNYTYTIHFESLENQDMALIARFQNTDNFVSCTFKNQYILTKSVINGKYVFNHKQKLNTPVDYSSDTKLAIKVNGNNVSCHINEQEISNSKIDYVPKYGGIGIKVWNDETTHIGLSIIDRIEVLPIKKQK